MKDIRENSPSAGSFHSVEDSPSGSDLRSFSGSKPALFEPATEKKTFSGSKPALFEPVTEKKTFPGSKPALSEPVTEKKGTCDNADAFFLGEA